MASGVKEHRALKPKPNPFCNDGKNKHAFMMITWDDLRRGPLPLSLAERVAVVGFY